MENVIVASGSLAPSPRHWGKSVAAVLAGLVAIVVTHTGSDAILHAVSVYPPAGQVMSDALFALALGYRLLFSVLGCGLTARLAPGRPLRHALLLGGIGTLGSLAGLLATLRSGSELGPVWYPLALVLTALPCAWLGAQLLGAKTRVSS